VFLPTGEMLDFLDTVPTHQTGKKTKRGGGHVTSNEWKRKEKKNLRRCLLGASSPRTVGAAYERLRGEIPEKIRTSITLERKAQGRLARELLCSPSDGRSRKDRGGLGLGLRRSSGTRERS